MSIVFLLLSSIITVSGYSQEKNNYEEVPVTLYVPRIGNIELQSLINNQDAYLPVKEIFDYLKIKNTISANYDSIAGFFINPKAVFLVDKINNRIQYQDKNFPLKASDLVITETNLYLKSEFFGQVFGLDCIFNFRNLSITLNTKIELPAIREMQQELIRKNLSQLKGERKADTTLKRKFSWFSLGTADWYVTTTQETKTKNNTRVNLNIGAIVAGGEATVNLNYSNDQPFSLKQQLYRWRYVNNDHAALRQITAGRIYAQSISSVYAPLNGVQFTNTPTTYRRSFGTYRISDKTEPGWMVELYINNVLVNYVKADASGFFTFDVPMVYGNSVVRLRFYGPWGEENMREQNINIPFSFLPPGQFEYTVSAGIVDDEQKSRFSRANFNYGLGKRITVGGGVEYLSSVMLNKPMPFANASLRLGSKLLISGEHDYGVRSKANINYRLPANIQLDMNYTKYVPGQTAVKFSYLEERKVVLSVPFRGKKFSAFSRLTYNRVTIPKYKYTSTEFLLSAVVAGISSNFTTYAQFTDPAHPNIYSNLSLSFRLPAGIKFTPQAQYQFTQKNFSMVKGEVEKRIGSIGYVNVSYEKNITNKISYINLGLRLNFSFAQTSFAVKQGNQTTTTVQSARGSMLYNGKTNYLGLNDQTSVGKGGLIISPFLDLNSNGKHDKGEPKAFGLNLRINGGRTERINTDTTLRITGLEAYTSYFIELDNSSFENVAWQLRKRTISVNIEPNNFKLIEVPVAVMGEASGTVFLADSSGRNGLGRIIVNFYNSDAVLVARTVTEADGYFSFLGLVPGSYTAQIDKAQLQKLQLASASVSFNILPGIEGDIVNGLQFILHSTREKNINAEKNR